VWCGVGDCAEPRYCGRCVQLLNYKCAWENDGQQVTWTECMGRRRMQMNGRQRSWSDAAAWVEVEIIAVAQEEGNRKGVSSSQLR
jgi:hypothetical protein